MYTDTNSLLVSISADIGGQLGLFVGASVITICEFLEYCIVKCSIIWRYHRTKRRMRQERSNTTKTAPDSRQCDKMAAIDINCHSEKDQGDPGKSVTKMTFL